MHRHSWVISVGKENIFSDVYEENNEIMKKQFRIKD